MNINEFGKYIEGLTWEETKQYLIRRLICEGIKQDVELKDGICQKLAEKGLLNWFEAWTKGQTKTTIESKTGQLHIGIFRHDVKRFADMVFNNKPTYFD